MVCLFSVDEDINITEQSFVDVVAISLKEGFECLSLDFALHTEEHLRCYLLGFFFLGEADIFLKYREDLSTVILFMQGRIFVLMLGEVLLPLDALLYQRLINSVHTVD